MNKDFIYRNIALLGGLFMLAGVFYFDNHVRFQSFSQLIDLTIVPITVIAASFWYKKNVVLLGVPLYFFNYTCNLVRYFDPNMNGFFIEYYRPIQIIGAIGLLLVVLSGMEKYNLLGQGWLNQKMEKPELKISIVVITSCLITAGVIFVVR